MLTKLITAKSITGAQTTAGVSEETVNLSVDGAVAAATIAVPAGQTFVVSDMIVGGAALTNWRLQKTDDGVAFTDLIVAQSVVGDANVVDLESPVKVVGGANVAVRLRAETPVGAGAEAVEATLRAFTQP